MGLAGNPTDYAEAVVSLHAGRGMGQAPWNPTRIVLCLKNLEEWGRIALLRHRTRLQCLAGLGHGVQRVTDCYDRRAALACGCKRPVHTMTTDEYQSLVDASQGLKVKRRPTEVGGWDAVQTMEAK